MPFTITGFIFFFLPISIIFYYIINLFKKDILNNLYLILISLLFYSFSGVVNALYLLAFITIVYLMSKILERYKNTNNLFLSITILILILSYYKYGLFVYELFSNISLVSITFSDIVIPLGTSFIIFESISYLIDIYKEKAKSGNYIDVLLFFLFFPKITSGPIVLFRDFYPQIKNRVVSVDLFYSGLERIMIGFAKKTIIADTLGASVANINNNLVNGIDSYTALLGMILYFLQIYYDFSGYSDIAIGISRLFGFRFKENFNYPYTSTTLAEFWRRWHISLGTWFREYIYIPLGGNRKHIYLNLFIVFLITGIWHGSTLNFVLWGLAHAIFIMIERYVRNKNWYLIIPSLVKWFIVTVFVMLTWVIFMLPELWQAKLYYLSLLGRNNDNIYFTYEYFLTNKILILVIIGLIGAFVGKLSILNKIKVWTTETKLGVSLKYFIYLILFIIALIFMVNSNYSPFLYFQF